MKILLIPKNEGIIWKKFNNKKTFFFCLWEELLITPAGKFGFENLHIRDYDYLETQ